MGRRSHSKSRRAEPAASVREPERTAAAELNAISWRTPLIAAAIALAILLVYAQVHTHDFTNYDDDVYVTANPHVLGGLSASGLRWAFSSTDTYWHPLTWISHMADVELFGVDAGAHALVNVAIHILNALLLFFLFQRTTAMTGRSAILALLFAIHPLHVESVAWIAERKDVLSGLFLLLTLHAWTSFASKRTATRYLLALVAFAFGLMSKGMIVTLPFVLLLFDYWPLRRFELGDRRAIVRAVMEKVPFFVLLVPATAITYLAHEAGGAIATNAAFGERMSRTIYAYAAYVAKTFWPTPLAIPYPPTPVEPWRLAISAVLLLVVTTAVFMLARTRRYLFTGWFWFVGVLLPVSGLVQIGWQSMADHYTYLPHIGLLAATVWGVAEILTPAGRRYAAAAAVIAAAFLGVAAHRQVAYWRDSIQLFSHAIAVTRDNSIAHMNLAAALIEKGDRPGGMRELGAAVLADPRSADALVKLARLEVQAGDSASAREHLQTAVTVDRKAETLALLALANDDVETALAHYREAVLADPASADLRNDYAAALARSGRDDQAIGQYREAIRLNPAQFDARMNLGALLSRLDRNDEARAQFEASARLRPSSPEPLVYLALLNANTGRIGIAIQNVEAALSINGADANLQFTSAVRMPFKETNLTDYLAYLRSRKS